ncbi:MAG: tRNA (5-methylaminomethyl-2-thiouridine)(34)-methyltransferase MnmD [Bacteroidetes bacterium]|nr:tRNA (5-methylaminomethyl-2-thiouridine)(34)-methyltransferase MnmD [Bacteroidota bacterium]MCY4205887.1 tRNA (5-methylaminomethyl-2-thiouridine)(34)-methyltransferase MnmD [Bacteroidota bacterium]
MDQSLRILTTNDGSRTLYSNRYQQSFHSVHGALTESKHVFVDGAKIEDLFRSKPTATILEIGFGTGLNWLLTSSLALERQIQLTYNALDQQIPTANLLSRLNYGSLVEATSLNALLIKWRNAFHNKIPDGVYQLKHEHDSVLQLFIGEATEVNLPTLAYDRIYLDAFDPTMNPGLWKIEFIQQLYDSLLDGGCLTTYSAAGHVRRALEGSGFSVIRRPGPPGKREVLAAWKS